MENLKQEETIPPQSPPIPQPTPSPTPQPPPKKKNLLVGVLITLAVLIGVAGIFVLMQEKIPPQIPEIKELAIITEEMPPEESPSGDTSGWQTYHKEIEFEYPEDWQIHFRQYSGGDHLIFSPKSIGEIEGKVYVKDLIYLLVLENTQGVSLNEYISNKWIDLVSMEDTVVANIPGKKVFYRELAVGEYASVDEVHQSFIILRENKIYEWIPGELTNDGQKAWDQILSTFRFIEPTDTSDWQTYRNEEFGFEIKYPEDLILVESPQERFQMTGEILSLVTPDIQRLVGVSGAPSYTQHLVISYWPDMNNSNARGGSWSEQRVYANLEDYLNNDEYTPKEKVGEIVIDEEKAFEVSVGGYGLNYAVMLEHGEGIYELAFERAWDKTYLEALEHQILSTFRFIDKKEILKIDSNVVWDPGTSVLGFFHDCPSAQVKCVSSVMKQNNAAEQAIEFFVQTAWFAVEFQDYGTVDLVTLVTPWRANSNNDYMLVNENSSYIIIENEVSGDLSEKIENYQVLSSAFPEYTIWGTDNWFIEQRDQSFLFGFDIKDERGCHACGSGYSAFIAFKFDSIGNYDGMEMLRIEEKTDL